MFFAEGSSGFVLSIPTLPRLPTAYSSFHLAGLLQTPLLSSGALGQIFHFVFASSRLVARITLRKVHTVFTILA
jgi:hypothetical protein